jgi:hypothetical protein
MPTRSIIQQQFLFILLIINNINSKSILYNVITILFLLINEGILRLIFIN